MTQTCRVWENQAMLFQSTQWGAVTCGKPVDGWEAHGAKLSNGGALNTPKYLLRQTKTTLHELESIKPSLRTEDY